MTQEARILDYLSTHRYGTGMDFVTKCGVLSYTKIISNINRACPNRIQSDWHENLRTGTRYKVYHMVGKNVDVLA